MRDLNNKLFKINDERLGLVSSWGRYLHDCGMPLNEIHWEFMKSVDDKCINMLSLKYVEYNEFINTSVRPFKKGLK